MWFFWLMLGGVVALLLNKDDKEENSRHNGDHYSYDPDEADCSF